MKYDFCQFKASSEGKPSELFFYGDIVSSSWDAWQKEDQYPQNVQKLLSEIGNGDVDIHINSGGGDVFAGIAIYNMLRSCAGKKTVYIDGWAASIASIIAMAGDEIIMPENSYLMVHKAWTVAMGNADEMRELADRLDKIDSGILATYMQHTVDGYSDEQMQSLVADETWLTAAEAAEIFSNIKAEQSLSVAAHQDSRFLAQYKNIPEGFNKKPEGIPNNGKPKATNVPDELKDCVKYLHTMNAVYGE